MVGDRAKPIYFIDSNIFLRVLIKEDPQTFADSVKLLELVQRRKIAAVTSSLVLAEISWVLGSYYKFNKNKTAQALEGIINLRGLGISDKTDTKHAVEIFAESAVKFINALTAANDAFAKKGEAIISYDRDFDKLGITRKEPRDLISVRC